MEQGRSRILVAEDDSASRQLLERILGHLGHEVISTATGTEAWEILRDEDGPRLAILDLMLPGVNGLELAEKTRSEIGGHYVYIIMLTGRGSTEDIVRGYEAGADDYIVKPFMPEELQVRVRVGERILALERKLAVYQYERAVLEMAATLGHEINNPLASIIPSVELLRMELRDPDGGNREKLFHRLDTIEGSALRIQSVVAKFASMAKVRLKTYLGDTSILDIQD